MVPTLRQCRVRRALVVTLLCCLALASSTPPTLAGAPIQPYGVAELTVRVGAGLQAAPLISGRRVIWRDSPLEAKTVAGRDLSSGRDFGFATAAYYGDRDFDGDWVVTAEYDTAGKGIFAYRYPSFERRVIAPMRQGPTFYRLEPRVSGNTVVWLEGNNPTTGLDVYGYDLNRNWTFPICTDPAQQEHPAISGRYVVWADGRNAAAGSTAADIYGYDLSAGREIRLSSQTGEVSAPAVSGSVAVWAAQRDRAVRILGYDLAAGRELEVTNLGLGAVVDSVDIDGDLVVWSMSTVPGGEKDVWGYDLRQNALFIVSRAIGDQSDVRIAGDTVVWVDSRFRGLGKYDQETDIMGAVLRAGPAPEPPVWGAPDAVDAKIEIVWPHGGAPVGEASLANVAAYLFLPGQMKPAPCQWHPIVSLWQALDNEPARQVAVGARQPYAPLWEFNDVDVSAERDPDNRAFFFVTVEGTPTRFSIWAHGADARTYFPQQDTPAGIAALADPPAVDARIEIVWPHDGAGVAEADLANVTAALFVPDTLQSVPPQWQPEVHLYRAVNNGLAEDVGVGRLRLVTVDGLTYPVWDFDNVDVSPARDPANKVYLTVQVAGVRTMSNVWAHAVDARTYMPEKDVLQGGCS